MIDELAKAIADEAEEELLAEIARLTARVAELEGALENLLHSLSLDDDEGLMEHAEPVRRARAALKAPDA